MKEEYNIFVFAIFSIVPLGAGLLFEFFRLRERFVINKEDSSHLTRFRKKYMVESHLFSTTMFLSFTGLVLANYIWPLISGNTVLIIFATIFWVLVTWAFIQLIGAGLVFVFKKIYRL